MTFNLNTFPLLDVNQLLSEIRTFLPEGVSSVPPHAADPSLPQIKIIIFSVDEQF